MKTSALYPKLYVGGWYRLKNPMHHVPMIVGRVVMMDMFNLYLN